MDKLRAAAVQALEALETLDCGDSYKTHNAATALREALAEQAEQEPVAWHEPGAYSNVTVYKNWANENGWIPLYAAPVRTKDLTDDEIADIRMSIVAYEPVEWGRVFARAVIAADREKNK